MSKQYGLIIPTKNKSHKIQEPVARPSIFESDSDDETPQLPTGLTKNIKTQDKLNQQKAIEEDPTVYQYDEVYDDIERKRNESKLARKDLDRKPKYIGRLLAAAERRKRENERRIERQVQKEREAEGDEFKEKESYVTSAYKKKLEEMKELDELEKREDYLESIGDVTKQENLDGFYRHLYEQKVKYDEVDDKKKVERQYRKRQTSSEDEENEKSDEINEEMADIKEHLPSNLDADSDFSIDSSDSEEIAPKTAPEPTAPPAETTPTPLAAPPTPPPPKPKINIWKKRTEGAVFEAALKRYHERKSQQES